MLARLPDSVEAFLNPEDAVAQDSWAYHSSADGCCGRGMEAQAGQEGGLWARACMYVCLLAGGPDSGAAAV